VLKASIWLPVENNLKCSSERELPFMLSVTSGRYYTVGMKQVSSKHVLRDLRMFTHKQKKVMQSALLSSSRLALRYSEWKEIFFIFKTSCAYEILK
jgi:hypothetical protein